MKRFSYYLFTLLAIVIIGLFVIKLPNGETVFSVDDLLRSVKRVLTIIPNDIELPNISTTQEKQVNVYMWVDEKGVTHYSDMPIKGAKQAELPEATVLPAKKVEWPEVQIPRDKMRKDNENEKSYFERINTLKIDAELAKKQLELRAKQQQELLNNL
ncbi:DUF4124 domain-containing protein [Pseudoalteromonas sp.]|uniref:DUF4124 domain-containing protein n=1 Tax=Pseudoalteromonas sp. TaxID=53249 RepID=UPI0035629A7D